MLKFFQRLYKTVTSIIDDALQEPDERMSRLVDSAHKVGYIATCLDKSKMDPEAFGFEMPLNLEVVDKALEVGDLVREIRYDYDKRVLTFELGIIISISESEQTAWVLFEDTPQKCANKNLITLPQYESLMDKSGSEKAAIKTE